MQKCSCGSERSFAECCGLYISGKSHAPDPESLMRSRYSAYVIGDTDYIGKTQADKAAIGYDPVYAKEWSKQAKWLGLKIIQAKTTQHKGSVEFLALYELAGKKSNMHEVSEFKHIDGRWFYTDGKFVKTGRNDDCPCGSGQKFKKCCGE